MFQTPVRKALGLLFGCMLFVGLTAASCGANALTCTGSQTVVLQGSDNTVTNAVNHHVSGSFNTGMVVDQVLKDNNITDPGNLPEGMEITEPLTCNGA